MLSRCHGGNFLVELYSSWYTGGDPLLVASRSTAATPAGLLYATYCCKGPMQELHMFLVLVYTWSP